MENDELTAGTEWGTVPEVLRIRGKAMGEKQNKRELILAAAQEIFFAKGYYNTTSEEIAKRAGVGKGTLYQYFDSKMDIFMEMHRLYIKTYTEKMSELIQDDASFEDNLRRMVHFHIENMQELARYAIRITSETPPEIDNAKGKEVLMDLKNSIHLVMDRLIQNGQQRGEIRMMDSRLIICYLIGNFLGISHLIHLDQISAEQRAELEQEVVQTVLHGLSMENSPASAI